MIDFRKIGRRMPRRRDERGWVKKVGKTQRMWEGYFNVYVRLADGTEKRRRTVAHPRPLRQHDEERGHG